MEIKNGYAHIKIAVFFLATNDLVFFCLFCLTHKDVYNIYHMYVCMYVCMYVGMYVCVCAYSCVALSVMYPF